MGEDSKKGLVLDKQAQKLFDQLGGIDNRERGYGASGVGGLGSDPLGEEQELLDSWRIVLADFVYVLGNFFYKIKLHGVKSVRAEDVAPIIDMLSKIHEMSERDDRIMIRFRGMKMPNEKPDLERMDYVVTCDGVMVDIPIMKALANRKGLTMGHLPGKLKAAFERFSYLDIHSICFSMGKWQQRDRDMMWTTLHAAGRFFSVYKTKIPPAGHENGEEVFQVVYNEQGEQDPNLTLLAAANGRSIAYIQSLVHKLRELMVQPKGVDALAHYVSSYDALFAFKSVQQKLRKPPLEINSLRRLVMSDDEAFTLEKSEVVRMIAQRLGGSPQELARTIDSVYGKDYSLLSAGNLNARLARVSRLLDPSKKHPVSRRAEKGSA